VGAPELAAVHRRDRPPVRFRSASPGAATSAAERDGDRHHRLATAASSATTTRAPGRAGARVKSVLWFELGDQPRFELGEPYRDSTNAQAIAVTAEASRRAN
jgi:hypothetical protein